MKSKTFEPLQEVHQWIKDNADECRAVLMAFESNHGPEAGIMCLMAVRDAMRALMSERQIMHNKRIQVAKVRP